MPNTTTLHTLLNVVEDTGSNSVVYPQNTGNDVKINKENNDYLLNHDITDAQKLSEVVGEDLLSRASDFSYENGVFKLLDGSGNVIHQAIIESIHSFLFISTNVESVFNTPVTVTSDHETLVHNFDGNGKVAFELSYEDIYYINSGVGSQSIYNASAGIQFDLVYNGQPVTIRTSTLKSKEFTCTSELDTIHTKFDSNGVASLILRGGIYILDCEGFTDSFFANGMEEYPLEVVFDKSNIYGFHINSSESVPELMITYPEDVENKNYEPVGMDFSSNTFSYGDWHEALYGWLLPKPCVLKQDGTVKYYVNPDDYSKTESGQDVTYDSGDNLMLEWGQNGKIICYKYENETFYFTDRKLDDSWNDFAFHGRSGDAVSHFYTSAYLLSDGQSKPGTVTEYEMSTAFTSVTSNAGWNFNTFAQTQLIDLLLILLSKTSNLTSVYGSAINSETIVNGTTATAGMFYGKNDGTSAVKVFGMENYWNKLTKPVVGLLYKFISSTPARTYGYYLKATYGKEDGTDVIGYSYNSVSGLSTNASILMNWNPSPKENIYIKKMTSESSEFHSTYGLLADHTYSGTESSYYCSSESIDLTNTDPNKIYFASKKKNPLGYNYNSNASTLVCVGISYTEE